MAGRILVIRGGAIGDFVLTLPAIALLRDAFPSAPVEILGYRHIVELAVDRHYAVASRSIEYGPLAGFFNPKSDLDPALAEWLSGFSQVVSYLFDPDEFFAGNLRRAGVKNLITGNPRPGDHAHAAVQLAEPLEQLALFLESPAAQLFPNDADREAAAPWLEDRPIALHPGSGGARKNWPVDRWTALARHLLAQGHRLVIVGGESDSVALTTFRQEFSSDRLRVLENLPLPALAAVFAGCRLFIGHDSGVSHVAAAAGAACLLLFGPTDPSVWAPANSGVQVLASPTGAMEDIPLDSVRAMADSLLANA